MAKLIALVCVTAHVDGKRIQFQAGEPIPDDVLLEHDIEALKRMKSVEDVEEVVADERLAKWKLERADAEYQEARRRVQAAQASIAPAGGNTESNISGSPELGSAAGGAIPGTNNTSESVASEASGASPDAGGQEQSEQAAPDGAPESKSRSRKSAAGE